MLSLRLMGGIMPSEIVRFRNQSQQANLMKQTRVNGSPASRAAGGLAVSLVLAGSAPTMAAFTQDLRMEPQPFRQAQVLDGREFDYNAESFIHRASFMPQLPVTASPIPEERLIGTGGSSRSDELFLDIALQTTYQFSEELDIQYRFRRSEDYDGRFDRNLVGLGYTAHPYWNLRIMADLDGDKSQTDLQPELTYRHPNGHQAVAALVFTDMLFNSKQTQDEYLTSPITAYFGGLWEVSDQHRLRAYANVTPETELEIMEADVFRNESARVGIGWDWRMPHGRHWQLIAEAEGTDREQQKAEGAGTDTMTRRYWRTRAEYQAPLSDSLSYRTGGQALLLRERGDFIGNNVELTDRKEWLAFAGISQRLNPEWTFSPTVFATVVEGDSRERNSDTNDEEIDDLNGVYGKITLPFEWQPQGNNGARITLNPTFRLHTAAFGGGNLQVSIPL